MGAPGIPRNFLIRDGVGFGESRKSRVEMHWGPQYLSAVPKGVRRRPSRSSDVAVGLGLHGRYMRENGQTGRRIGVEGLDNLYRLQTFQLGRLNHVLAQRDRVSDLVGRRLADACIASLYLSCIEAGVGPQARVLIDTYRRPTSSSLEKWRERQGA